MFTLLNSTTISSLVFVIVAAGMWHMAGGLSETGRFFPRVVAGMLALFSILQLALSVAQIQKEAPFAGVDFKRVLALVLGMAAYAALMIYFGFVLSSILFLSFFFWFLSRDRQDKFGLPGIVLTAVGVSGGFYGLFHYVFSVPLPAGVIFGG